MSKITPDPDPSPFRPAYYSVIRTALVLSLILLAGCRVGPDYKSPPVEVARSWIDSGNSRLRGDATENVAWWTTFDDPVLTHLIADVQGQNLTLQIAGTRILEARALLGQSQSGLAPQDQIAFGGIKHHHISKNSPTQAIASFLQKNDFDQWTQGIGAAWELDFWGKYRRTIIAAHADVEAATASFDETSLLLAAETAQTYLQLRTLEHRLVLARQNVKIQTDTLQITESREEAGTDTDLDVLRATSNVKETESLIPALKGLHRVCSNRLCILLGIPPRDLSASIGQLERIPVPNEQLAVGLPADLLRRRPDVCRAERELAAQSERIGIAAADFYPQLSISGNVGLDALDLSKLYSLRSVAAFAGPSFRWNILNYGRIQNNVRYQEARYQELLLAYRNTVLRADEEAENAIIRYLSNCERIELLRASVKAAQASVKLVQDAYRLGAIDYHPLFILESQLVVKQDSLAIAQGELAGQFVEVYKVMGGGWSPAKLGHLPPVTAEEIPSPPPVVFPGSKDSP